MKTSKLIFILALMFSVSCASTSYWKVKIKMPREGLVDINQFEELIITNFIVEDETEGLDINKELSDYLTTELKKDFKGKVITKQAPLKSIENFKEPDFWKSILQDPTGRVFLSGSAKYSHEIRKAFLEKRPAGSRRPFFYEKGLAQRNFFTLILEVYLIQAETGEILYQRKFKVQFIWKESL